MQIGRSVLINWLLGRALDDDRGSEQAEAEHALLNLLADGEQNSEHITDIKACSSVCILSSITHSAPALLFSFHT